MKTLMKLHVLASIWPLFPLIGMWLFAVFTSLLFGAWPTYGNPDPQDVVYGVPDALVMLLHYGLVPAFSTSVVLGPHLTWRCKDSKPFLWLLFSLFLIGLLQFQWTSDPLGLTEWFID